MMGSNACIPRQRFSDVCVRQSAGCLNCEQPRNYPQSQICPPSPCPIPPPVQCVPGTVPMVVGYKETVDLRDLLCGRSKTSFNAGYGEGGAPGYDDTCGRVPWW